MVLKKVFFGMKSVTWDRSFLVDVFWVRRFWQDILGSIYSVHTSILSVSSTNLTGRLMLGTKCT